jgi:DNA-directed RNA polymerase specialized sigma24 family protein
MEPEIRRFEPLISIIESKLCPRASKQDKQDIRQEVALVLFKKSDKLSNHPSPKKLAYRIIRSVYVDWIRKQPPKGMESLSNPSVVKQYDKQSMKLPDNDIKLDYEKALSFIYKLPIMDRHLILMYYNIGDIGVTDCTDKVLAKVAFENKSEDWVRQKRLAALQKLREMMCIE